MPGYGDPPRHSRFKPGQSGNPSGGPKGPRREPVERPSTYLDERLTCRIGGKPFKGTRREAVVQIATLWSITRPIPGSKARGATEREKLPKPDLRLQQKLHKLMELEEESNRRIQRDEPKIVILDFPSDPDCVFCIEDAADVAGFGIKAYHRQKSARVLLKTWAVEWGLARLGDRRPTRMEQEQVLAATRFPKTVSWPAWWEPDLRQRGKGWRAPPVARNVTKPKAPDTIRMGLNEYLEITNRQRLRRAEFEYAREYAAMSPEDQEVFRKPFERPGLPSRHGGFNPLE